MTQTLRATERRLGCLLTVASFAGVSLGLWFWQGGGESLPGPLRTLLAGGLCLAGGLGLYLAVTYPPKRTDRLRASYSLDALPACLRPHQDALAKLLRPCLPLTPETLAPDQPDDPAESKLGGLPLMPPPHDWPRTSSGRPMVFVGQLNFARLAAELAGTGEPVPADMPRAGLLQLFSGWRDWDPTSPTPPDDIWRTRWLPSPEPPAAPASPPENTELLPAHFLHATAARSLPETGDIAKPAALFHDDPACLEAYDDLLSILFAHSGEGQLLGHGCWDADPRRSLDSPDSWRLLWQLHGRFVLEVGDTGPIYILISASDLAAGRFDRLLVRTEF